MEFLKMFVLLRYAEMVHITMQSYDIEQSLAEITLQNLVVFTSILYKIYVTICSVNFVVIFLYQG